MVGLLYKDFVAIHGKYIAAALAFITLLILLFSVLCRSDEVLLAAGAFVIGLSLILPLAIPLYMESAIFAADEGKKKKAYLFGLPISKRQQIASKYLFIGIAYYAAWALDTLWGMFIGSAMKRVLEDLSMAKLLGLVALYIHLLLILSALKLPFFAALGVRAGNALRQGILLIFFSLFTAYLLFGDLNIWGNYDVMSLTALMQERKGGFPALLTLSLAAVLFYYLSYRLSGALYAGKEPQDE